jgi:hypothetical protein
MNVEMNESTKNNAMIKIRERTFYIPSTQYQSSRDLTEYCPATKEKF